MSLQSTERKFTPYASYNLYLRQVELFQLEAESYISKHGEVKALIESYKADIAASFSSFNTCIESISEDIKLRL